MIALHNYHDTLQAFPAGRGGPASSNGNVNHNSSWGTTLAVLPYIEQSARFERWLEMQNAHGGQCPPAWSIPSGFGDFYSKSISAFACPSDSGVLRWAPGLGGLTETFARGSYVTCRADLIKDNHSISTTENQYTRSVFGVGIYYDISSIIDGTSNTLGLSERVAASDASTRVAIESFYSNTSGTIETNPTTGCAAYKVGNTYPTGTIADTNVALLFSGHVWHTGAFTTVLPPNSASCLNGTGSGGQSWGIISASSRHSGGANTALMDGSVSFVSETINSGNLTWSPGGTTAAPNNTNKPLGDSNYGVWGARGTRAGSENKTF
jgi:prepilin-type processing-associated H-X9-DG protein